MPKQFTPAPREDVLDTALEMEEVSNATIIGPGVRVIYRPHDSQSKNYSNLVENRGWYVAEFYPHDKGDRVVLMPITEVNV